MATDVLTLGGVQFLDFATPEQIGAGGRQTLVIHRLPGGARVIDTLGPDENNIGWEGKFFQDDALDVCLALDGLRAAGAVLPLSFAGIFRLVYIENFAWTIRRYPFWVAYRISCVIVTNPGLGDLGAGPVSSTDMLISDDLGSASDEAAAAVGP